MLRAAARRLFSSSSQQSNCYDIVIVGSGMVGAALSCALGKWSNHSDVSCFLLCVGGKKVVWGRLDVTCHIFYVATASVTAQ